MGLRQAVTRVGAWLLAAALLVGAVYWGVNAYLFTYGENSNSIAVAASAAFASLFLVGAIFIGYSDYSVDHMCVQVNPNSDNVVDSK